MKVKPLPTTLRILIAAGTLGLGFAALAADPPAPSPLAEPAAAPAAAATPSPPAPAMTDAAGLIRAAEEQMQRQDIAAAVASLEQAVAAAPDSALAHTRLGGAYLLDQRFDPAIEEFQRAISLDANNDEAFIGMALAYLHGGRLGLARAALVEARRIAPDKAARIDEVMIWIDQRAQ